MRGGSLATQNRLIGGLTLVIGALAAGVASVVWPMLVGDGGHALYTLTRDVDGIQTGSIVVVNGHEVGQVTEVAVADSQGTRQDTLDAAEPMFRVDFAIADGVRLPARTTRLRVARPNPVSLARLVVVQVPEKTEALADTGPAPADTTTACTAAMGMSTRASAPPACPTLDPDTTTGPDGTFGPGACVPIAATGDILPSGLDGVLEQANAVLCELRLSRTTLDTTLSSAEEALSTYTTLGEDLREAVWALRPGLERSVQEYEALPKRLRTSLDGLDQALASLDTTVSQDIPARLEQVRRDLVERADRVLDPETLAAFARAVKDLEVLTAESSRQSFQVMQNLTAASRSLNEIARELNRDPAGFLLRDRTED